MDKSFRFIKKESSARYCRLLMREVMQSAVGYHGEASVHVSRSGNVLLLPQDASLY